jgi:Ca2+-transporting ATPase
MWRALPGHLEGRTTADDIRKSVHFIVGTNLSEITAHTGRPALGFGVPLNATQLSGSTCSPTCSPSSRAVDPPENDVLTRPPRPSNAALVARHDYPRLAVDGLVMTGAAMTSYAYGLRRYGPEGGAGTMAFLTLTGAQLLHAFSSRSESHSVLDWRRPPNPWIGLSVATGFGIQLLAAVVPGLRRLLGTAPVSAGDAALSWGFAGISFVLGETIKVATPSPHHRRRIAGPTAGRTEP